MHLTIDALACGNLFHLWIVCDHELQGSFCACSASVDFCMQFCTMCLSNCDHHPHSSSKYVKVKMVLFAM